MASLLFRLSSPPSLHSNPSTFLLVTSQPKPYPPISLSIARKQRPFFSIVALSSSSVAAPAVPSEGPLETSLQPRKRLIAQNIPWTSTAEDIANLFQKYGTVLDVEVPLLLPLFFSCCFSAFSWIYLIKLDKFISRLSLSFFVSFSMN